jgi:hypothetical protein
VFIRVFIDDDFLHCLLRVLSFYSYNIAFKAGSYSPLQLVHIHTCHCSLYRNKTAPTVDTFSPAITSGIFAPLLAPAQCIHIGPCFHDWYIYNVPSKVGSYSPLPASKASGRYARFLQLVYCIFTSATAAWPHCWDMRPCSHCWDINPWAPSAGIYLSLPVLLGYIHPWPHCGIFIPGPSAGYTFIPGPAGIGPSVGLYSFHSPQMRYIHPWPYC